MTNDESEKEKSRTGSIFPAAILLILGIVFLFSNFMPDWRWDAWWPIFVFTPGIAFFLWFFIAGEKTKLSGILIPGTILTFLGLFFFIMSSIDWRYIGRLWPTFILIPGLSFFITYFGSGRRLKALQIPGWILTGLAIIFYLNLVGTWKFWPLLLIALGILLILKRK